MVAGVVGEDVGIEPQTFAFDGADGTGGDFAAQGLVINGVVDARGEAGIELVPEPPAMAIIHESCLAIEVARMNLPEVINIEHVMRDVFK